MLHISPARPLQEIVGIGPVLANRLLELGFEHDVDVLALPEATLIGQLAQVDGLSCSIIQDSLLPQARILRLPGSSGSLAHALVNDGFRHYSDFLGNQTARIKRIVLQSSEVRTHDERTRVSDIVSELLLTAVQLATTGSVRIGVKNRETREGLAGAEVAFDGDRRMGVVNFTSRLTDEAGFVDFEGIAPLPTTFRVSANGFKTQSVMTAVEEQRYESCTALMSVAASATRDHDEFQGGLTVGSENSPTFPRRFELSELPARPPVYVETISEGQANLGSLWFWEESGRIIIPVLRVLVKDLPDGTKVGDVLIANPDSWAIHPDNLTAAEFRQGLMRNRSSIEFGHLL